MPSSKRGKNDLFILHSNKQVTNLWDTRGKDMFLKIYGGNSTDREDTMKSANPDLWYWCKEGYGDYISDSTYLDYAETELEVIVSLIQMDALPQVIYLAERERERKGMILCMCIDEPNA